MAYLSELAEAAGRHCTACEGWGCGYCNGTGFEQPMDESDYGPGFRIPDSPVERAERKAHTAPDNLTEPW